MKHYGDITKLNGHELPIVDVVTGGSPCQDLSVAGKRAGLDGERSGLFMEQIRIVKEMRDESLRRLRSGRADVDLRHIRPRFLVWENVPGAFSSGKPKGADFQAVLTEIVHIVCKNAPDVPLPERGGWSKAGCLNGVGDNGQPFSVAWKVHDAQWWGVPQRRKRIALLADFNGLSAGEILFDPQCRRESEIREQDEALGSVRGRTGGSEILPESESMSGDSDESGETREGTAGATGEGPEGSISFQERAGKPGGGKGLLIQSERTGALSTLNNQSVFSFQGGGQTSATSHGSGVNEDVMFTLNSVDAHAVAAVDCRNGTEDECTNASLQASANHNVNSNNVVRVSSS